MTVDTDPVESLLRDAFTVDDAPSFVPASIERVQRGAVARRRRRGGLTIAGVLLAIVGIAGVAGLARSDGPERVFASQMFDGAGESVASSDASATSETRSSAVSSAGSTLGSESGGGIEPTAAQLVADGSRFELLDQPQIAELYPSLWQVVADGDGGFVGLTRSTERQSGDITNLVIRSDDGETWQATHEWELGAYQVTQLQRSGSHWVAVLHTHEPRTFRGGTEAPRLEWNRQVAISDDLASWQHFELPLDLRERLIESLANPDELLIEPVIMGIGRVGNTTAVQVGWFFEPAMDQVDGACGWGNDDRGVFVVDCDGSIDVQVDPEAREALGLDVPTMLITDGSAPLEPTNGPAMATFVATPDRFVGIGQDLTTLFTSTDGRAWVELATMPSPTGADWRWWPTTDDGTGSVAMVGSSSAGDTRVAIVDVETGESVVRAVPLSADVWAGQGQLAHGPAGWSLLVSQSERSPRGVVENGWHAHLWNTGTTPDGLQLAVTTVDGDELLPTYLLDLDARAIEAGVFGELRVRRPGTDEVLIDATDGWSSLYSPFGGPAPLRSALPERWASPVVVDGWRVTGDPIGGPLVIERPGVGAQVFDDGFAFVNGDFDDGIELLGAAALDPEGGTLTVFDDGEPVWSVPFAEVLGGLATDVDLTGDFSSAPEPGDAWLLTSEDGRLWSVAWARERADLGDYPAIVVGDREVLVQSYGWPTSPSFTIVLDE